MFNFSGLNNDNARMGILNHNVPDLQTALTLAKGLLN